MIGKVTVRSWSNKVLQPTCKQLMAFPMKELREYAKLVGVSRAERANSGTKMHLCALICQVGGTICASLGD